ncbi:hypothetical protein LTR95_015736 [Oleoguttula sp. CCFEE 5521]
MLVVIVGQDPEYSTSPSGCGIIAAMEGLCTQWNDLYRTRLPAMAKARDPAQPKWPVFLDHCFARIVLDNAVGIDKPWTEVVKSPAVKNMSEEQLTSAISLAEKLANGEANLVELDERSLELRGKASKTRTKRTAVTESKSDVRSEPKVKKRKPDDTISRYFMPSPDRTKQSASPAEDGDVKPKPKVATNSSTAAGKALPDMKVQLDRIAGSTTLTPFRKQTLSMLCQVPPGRYSTYQAMSDYITSTSHKTCARAIGNAMRNNPFAPEVPCHRILAADGTLGGFGGSWGEEGKHASKKHAILHEEGVRFDSKGKVKGPPFREFHA